ncbi:MAG: hypothetical protein SOI44_06705 [Lactimicrobium sp.]|jgi:hypothetical protein|uniref:hypothetical protein n=1 Tax=Lactimicrobium sp. TaxID=2563780 RepID=UPI002F353498
MAVVFDFPISPLFFWIKGHIEVDNQVTKIETRNTVLGFLPAGTNRQTIPMSNVSSVSVRTGIRLKSIIFGIILAGIGSDLLADSSSLLGIILLLIGISDIIAGVPTYLDIETGASTKTIFAPFFAKRRVKTAADAMNYALANNESRRNISLSAGRAVDVIDIPQQ